MTNKEVSVLLDRLQNMKEEIDTVAATLKLERGEHCRNCDGRFRLPYTNNYYSCIDPKLKRCKYADKREDDPIPF